MRAGMDGDMASDATCFSQKRRPCARSRCPFVYFPDAAFLALLAATRESQVFHSMERPG